MSMSREEGLADPSGGGGLAEEDLKDVFVGSVSSIEEAVMGSVKAHGDPDVAVVPEGPYVIPRCH